MTTPDPNFYCSALARDNDEPQFATAPQAKTWLLLEFAGEWRAKATNDNALPDNIKTWLDEQMAELDLPRLQFIKQPPALPGKHIDFFVAFADGVNTPRLYHFKLDSYDDLLALDLGALKNDDTAYAENLSRDTLVLVCNNGKRDRCCAQRGVGVYMELKELIGESVWQTTHLGGHRFAANGVILPAGIMVGRLNDIDLADFVDDLDQGKIAADLYRGRACWPAAGQAAEYLLREESGTIEFAGDELLNSVDLADDRWQVELRAPDGTVHTKEIEHRPVSGDVYASCGSFKTKATEAYRMVK